MRPNFLPRFFYGLLLLCSCSAPISVDRMAEITGEMLLIDQMISDYPIYSSIADTTLIYTAILQKYGYSEAEYLRSFAYHIQKPEKFKRAMVRYRDQMMKKKNALQEEVNKALLPQDTSILVKFPPISLWIDSVALNRLDSLNNLPFPFILKLQD